MTSAICDRQPSAALAAILIRSFQQSKRRMSLFLESKNLVRRLDRWDAVTRTFLCFPPHSRIPDGRRHAGTDIQDGLV
jgi:hypothetical protein